MKTEFYTKQGEVIIKLAEHLLQVGPGDRLPSVSDYCALLSAGSGTVQAALKTLIDAGAIVLESHGYQGTHVVSTNLSLLWKFSQHSVLIGCMPLPYTKRFQGMATALYQQFEQANIPLSLNYVRGGRWRVQRLMEGHIDYTICSRLTAKSALEEYSNICVALDLGERSFVGQCCILFASPNENHIRNGMRIGVDRGTYDHVVFNEALCKGLDVTFEPLNYPQIFSALRKGLIDATMWNMDEDEERYIGLKSVPAAISSETKEIEREFCWGVILTRDDDPQYASVIRSVVNVPQLHAVQKSVIEDRIIPAY